VFELPLRAADSKTDNKTDSKKVRNWVALVVVAVAMVVAVRGSSSSNEPRPTYAIAPGPVSSNTPTTNAPATTTAPVTTTRPPTKLPSGVVAPPGTIDATGAQDVTTAFNRFLAGVPNGSTVMLPRNSRYRIEGTLRLQNHSNVVIEGQGATFFASYNGLVKAVAGCSQLSSVCRYPNRTRAQWSLESDSNLLVRDLNVVGSSSNPGPNGAYEPALEAQHAFQILGGRDIVLDHVSARNVWGDLVNVGKAQSGSVRSPTNVTIQNSTFHGASRQGWSITNGQHVTFVHNILYSARRSLIDVEANTSDDQIAFITIRDNQLGSYRLCTFTNYGAPAAEHDFVFADNRGMGAVPMKICVQASPTARRKNFEIVNNVGATGPWTLNEPMVAVAYFDNVTVKGNVQGFAAGTWPKRAGVNGGQQAPVTSTCSTVSVSGNRFTPRPSAMRDSVTKPC
jgi:hypothetical protein